MRDLSPDDAALLKSLLPVSLSQALQQPAPPTMAIVDACARLEQAIADVAAFVPSAVLDMHLAPSRTERVGARFIRGTVLFADLSGLTALSSQLISIGRAGDEEISTILNCLFGVLVAEVYEYGGGVIKFGGDSLTAFFDAQANQDHCALACAAALAMQRRMAAFAEVQTSQGSFPLQLRIAIHTGQLFAVEVGDRSHVELILTGGTINRLALAEKSAAPGEVIITDDILRALDRPRAQPKLSGLHRLHSLAAEPGHPLRVIDKVDAGAPSLATLAALLQRTSMLRPYLTYGLPERFIQSGSTHGEFRPVTVLFANFYPFSRILTLLELPALIENDMAMIGTVLNTYYTRIQAVIHHYGGSINKIDMGAFGDRVMALFGAPAAHEDDPVRAVQTAVHVRAALDDVGQEVGALLHTWVSNHSEQRSLLQVVSFRLRARIGIASGGVFAGTVGTPQRHEYTVIGGTVRLAERLMSMSDGDILLTSMVERNTRHVVRAEALPLIQVSGFPQPVQAFRVEQASRDAGDSHDLQLPALPLVGRRLELVQIVDLAELALAASVPAGQIVEIAGEPGIGKSRLASEVVACIHAQAPAARLIINTCHSYEQHTPYAVIIRLLRQLLPLASDDGDAQAAALQHYFDLRLPRWSRFAPLLGALLDVPLADTDLTLSLTLEQRRERLHDLLVALCFEAATRSPLLVAIDDLQWADASTLVVVRQIAAELAEHAFMLLLIYRPPLDRLDTCQSPQHWTRITLKELARPDSEMLLAVLLEGQLPRQLAPLIERAQGIPFFLEETVRYLCEAGVLQRADTGEWVCTGMIDSSTVPAQIEQVIVARIDRLTEAARTLIQIGAVLGNSFSEHLLAHVAPNAQALPEALAELAHAALVLPDELEHQPTYRFKHAMIRDVAYSSMLLAHRQELHQQAAQAVEQMYADELDAYRSIVAQHYLRAGAIDNAFQHILKLAQQARSRYAHAEALDLYSQALAIAPWRDQSTEWPDVQAASTLHEDIGELMVMLDNYAGAREQYQRGIQLIEWNSGGERAIRIALLSRKVGGTYEHQGDLDLALSWFERAMRSIASASASDTMRLEYAQILSDIGWVYFRQGDLAQAERHLTQALAQAGGHTAYNQQARIHNRLGGVAYTRGDLGLARHYVEQSLAASEQSGNLLGQADALNNLGVLTESQGRIEESIGYSLRAMAINERIGSRRDLAINAINIGWAYYSCEDYQRARAYLQQALGHATDARDTYHQMLALLDLGRVLTPLEEWDAAERALRQSQALALQMNTSFVLECHVALAELALQQGHATVALDEYHRASALEIERESEEFGRFQRLEAKLALARGDHESASAALHATHALFGRLQNVPEQERTQKILAGVSSLADRLV